MKLKITALILAVLVGFAAAGMTFSATQDLGFLRALLSAVLAGTAGILLVALMVIAYHSMEPRK
ncbi:MAG: hypothetical protein F4X64_04605 [Chloroflexi bacterium]|nr:hypothetical protein [Chloroflexota bacterium]